jgi:hypothetical protein
MGEDMKHWVVLRTTRTIFTRGCIEEYEFYRWRWLARLAGMAHILSCNSYWAISSQVIGHITVKTNRYVFLPLDKGG